MPCNIQHSADGSGSIFTSICATLGNFRKNMLMHIFSLTLKYTRPLCQLWMSFVFPKTGAPVEMLTFLLSLNKGNFNGDALWYPHEHRGTHTHTHTHKHTHSSTNIRTKLFLFSEYYPPIFPVDRPNTVHIVTFGVWCSKLERKLKCEKLKSNKIKNTTAMIMQTSLWTLWVPLSTSCSSPCSRTNLSITRSVGYHEQLRYFIGKYNCAHTKNTTNSSYSEINVPFIHSWHLKLLWEIF